MDQKMLKNPMKKKALYNIKGPKVSSLVNFSLQKHLVYL